MKLIQFLGGGVSLLSGLPKAVAQHVDRFPDSEEKYSWVLLRVQMSVRLILELWLLRQ